MKCLISEDTATQHTLPAHGGLAYSAVDRLSSHAVVLTLPEVSGADLSCSTVCLFSFYQLEMVLADCGDIKKNYSARVLAIIIYYS